MSSWTGNTPQSEDGFSSLCPNAGSVYSCQISGSGNPLYLSQCRDTVDNDNDGFIDAADSNCHKNNDVRSTYFPNHSSEAVAPQ